MSVEELKDAVREMLIHDGDYYSNLKASLQHIVFDKLSRGAGKVVSTAQNDDIAITDALIVEYLMWRGCQHACSVFKTEGGLGPERLRKDLLRDLNVTDVDAATNEVPVLLAILQQFKDDSN